MLSDVERLSYGIMKRSPRETVAAVPTARPIFTDPCGNRHILAIDGLDNMIQEAW
jgi:hypothetical protein